MSLLILKDIENEEIKQCEFHVGDIVIQTRKSSLIPQGTACIITAIKPTFEFPYKIQPIDPIFPTGLWWPREDIKHKELGYAFNF